MLLQASEMMINALKRRNGFFCGNVTAADSQHLTAGLIGQF